jgi:hypothetical protein
MTASKLTSTDVTYLLVAAKAAGRLTVAGHGDYVRVTGPEDDRIRAFHVLTLGHGLSVIPCGDHDDYFRDGTGG